MRLKVSKMLYLSIFQLKLEKNGKLDSGKRDAIVLD
jgi:hypothetical protein